MKREEAKQYLAETERRSLTAEQAEERLSDLWGMDADDEEFGTLPESLQEEIETTDGPAGDPLDARYESLLLISLRWELFGVTNSYLSSRVSAAKQSPVEVEGRAEPMERCPCCFYRSLPDRGEHDICPVCFWEDDGGDDEHEHSGCNHMSLVEARAAVAKVGVIDEPFKDSVARDARERYEYGG